MPELSRFLGIIIAMYYRDHPALHFHAIYGEHEATVGIETGQVTGNSRPGSWAGTGVAGIASGGTA